MLICCAEMKNRQIDYGLAWAAAALLGVGVGMGVSGQAAMLAAAEAVRWVGVALLLGFGVRRRSLTVWIVISMVVGVELGVDFKKAALELRFLSDIFLRLIKTIVGPLILGTLISGIAGHGDLKSVGRMAWKS